MHVLCGEILFLQVGHSIGLFLIISNPLHWYRPLWGKWWYFSFQKWMLSNNWTIWQSTIERIMLETCLSQIVLFRSPIKLLITKKLLNTTMTALFFSNCQVHRCSCTQSDNISLLLRILKAHVIYTYRRTVSPVVRRKRRTHVFLRLVGRAASLG